MIKVAICVCTRRRKTGLKKLLGSFEAMIVPDGTDVRIIIVENDNVNESEDIVKEAALTDKLTIDYYLEKTQGLVYARNRSVKEAGECDFCCFTDDDEIVSANWLTELLRCQAEFDADAVAGRTNPVFEKEVPDYIEKFHEPDSYPYGTIVHSAFTGCLLVRKKYLDMAEGPFNIKLNFSGGEDSYFTKHITSLGAIIRFNPEAVAYEFIPNDRTTIKYVIRRSFRTSNTEMLVRSIKEPGYTKTGAVPRQVLRFTYGFIMLIPYLIFGKANRLKMLIKLTNAVGGLAFIFGKQSEFYK